MENVVTKGAKAAEPMDKVSPSVVPGQSINDLGGPTPENYTNEPEGPAKLKDAAAPLSQVKDVVNKGAGSADGMEKMADSKVVPGSNSGGTTDSALLLPRPNQFHPLLFLVRKRPRRKK